MSDRDLIRVVQVESIDEDVRSLVGELDGELSAEYPPEQRHGLRLDQLLEPHMLFFTVYSDGKAVACGGVALFAAFGEIKRMYVRPEARGKGFADLIIERVEAEALTSGVRVLRLETGTNQVAAIRFYERKGFCRCEAFEPYSSMSEEQIRTSLFFEKVLGSLTD